jgi:hypothetical protein
MEFNINSIDIPKQPGGTPFCSTFSIIGFLNNLLGLNPPLNPNDFQCRAVDAGEISGLISSIKGTIAGNDRSEEINTILDSLNIAEVRENTVNPGIFNGVIDPANPNGNYNFMLNTTSGLNAHWTIANVIIEDNTVTINTYDSGNRVREHMNQMYRESFIPQLRNFLEGANANADVGLTNKEKLEKLKDIFRGQDAEMLNEVLIANNYNLEQTTNQLIPILIGGSSNKRRYLIKY